MFRALHSSSPQREVSQAADLDFKIIAVPVGLRMEKGEEDQVGIFCADLGRSRWRLEQGDGSYGYRTSKSSAD